MEHITNHVDAAAARLALQYRSKANMVALLGLFSGRFQTLEDAFQDLFSLTNLATAEGVWLDAIGAVVGEPRADSATDTIYRMRLAARIVANRSCGTPEDLYNVARRLLGPVDMRFEGGVYADYVMSLITAITTELDTVARFLETVTPVGVQGYLAWNTVETAEAFTIGRCTTLDGDALGGGTVINVVSTEGFPDSGTLEIDSARAGGPYQCDYGYKTATQFYVDSCPEDFEGGEVVTLVTTADGRGFAEASTTGTTTVGEHAIGATTLNVDDADAFPASGALSLTHPTSGVVCYVAYSAKGGTSFTLTAALAAAWPKDTLVYLDPYPLGGVLQQIRTTN